jgi:hypothetical protein
MNASEIFDEALNKLFAAKRSKFLHQVEGIFSNETENSLVAKAELVRQRMNEGRKFSEICDDPDIFLGSLDREYVSYRLDLDGFLDAPISLEKWRSNHLFLTAWREIQ